MKNFDPKYNAIPKTEIHIHLEGAIRTQTIIDIAKEYNLKLPAYDVSELDKHVKVYDQMRDLQAVLDAFDIFQRTITSPAVFERISWELFEDCAKQNIKLFEVRFSPDWAFHGHNLDWDACLEGLLRAKVRAEKEFDMAIGIIAITSRGMGAAMAALQGLSGLGLLPCIAGQINSADFEHLLCKAGTVNPERAAASP